MRKFTLEIAEGVNQKSPGFRQCRQLLGYILEGGVQFITRTSVLDARLGDAKKRIHVGWAEQGSVEEAFITSETVATEITPVSDADLRPYRPEITKDDLKLHIQMADSRYITFIVQTASGRVLYNTERVR